MSYNHKCDHFQGDSFIIYELKLYYVKLSSINSLIAFEIAMDVNVEKYIELPHWYVNINLQILHIIQIYVDFVCYIKTCVRILHI